MKLSSIERIIFSIFMIYAAIIIQEYLRMKNITNPTATYITISTLTIATTTHKPSPKMCIFLNPLDNPKAGTTRESNKSL